LLIFDEASAGMQAFVSNLSPHFVQDQRLTTKRSLTNSDQSGAISISPHLAQIVVMAFSFAYSCSPLQWGVFWNCYSRFFKAAICIDIDQNQVSFASSTYCGAT
jgi:hypothetical protein